MRWCSKTSQLFKFSNIKTEYKNGKISSTNRRKREIERVREKYQKIISKK